MKYVIAFCLLIMGCSTISEYNQGCRDGIKGWTEYTTHPDLFDRYCNHLDIQHNKEKHQGEDLKEHKRP